MGRIEVEHLAAGRLRSAWCQDIRSLETDFPQTVMPQIVMPHRAPMRIRTRPGAEFAFSVMTGRLPATHPRLAGAPRTLFNRRCVGAGTSRRHPNRTDQTPGGLLSP